MFFLLQYLGVWYEFFRYDEATSKNVNFVSANYTLNNSIIQVKSTMKVLPVISETVMLGQARFVNVTNLMETILRTFNSIQQKVNDLILFKINRT